MTLVTQIAEFERRENNAHCLDPLFQLGRLCGIDGLGTDSHGLCCLAFGNNGVIHMFRVQDGAAVILSTELQRLTSLQIFAAYRKQRVIATLQGEGSDLHLGASDTLCLQRTFDATLATPDGTSNGMALLADIDLLLSHANVWRTASLEFPAKTAAYNRCQSVLIKPSNHSASIASAH